MRRSTQTNLISPAILCAFFLTTLIAAVYGGTNQLKFFLNHIFIVFFVEPFQDFISNLSDRINEIKRAVLDSHNQGRSSRSSTFDTQSSIITDRFVSRDPSQIRFFLYDKRL